MSKISSIILDICEMYVSGISIVDIANTLNLSVDWVEGVINEYA